MAEMPYDRVNDYAAVKITLASPNDIRSWSFGEVKKPETINYRTYRPEKDGLFCERIFGPERDYECACGKYKGTKFKGIICDRCGVKVTHSRVRRKRMGHINLAAPIIHIWFFKAIPSHLGNLLGMKTSDLEKVIYFQDYVVTDAGDTPLKEKQLLTEDEYRQALDQYGNSFRAVMGAESIKELLGKLDLAALAAELREDLRNTRSKQKVKDLSKRLKIVEQIRTSENRPEWMVMDVVPVIPPDLRPLVLLESGNFATSDLNDLYRRIINRNNRLKKLMDLNAPEVIIRNEKRMLQQSVDALFDNGRCRRPVLGSSNRPLKSLTDMIKGKQGRFRENLLGKRVDYSARSVIVVGPELKLNQCGLPKKIALELYQPFIIRKLKEHGLVDTIKSAKKMLERRDAEVWDILEEVIYQHPVLLNRAPTLHRMGIQAFEPVLVEGNAIKIHPLVCTGFNADFDGDQMAVHLPLSVEAQAEAHILMLSPNNIFSPANGNPIISPSQDIVLGVYYITSMPQKPTDMKKVPTFKDPVEAMMAYDLKKITIHDPIHVRLPSGRYAGVVEEQKGELKPMPANHRLLTTIGRILFNDILEQGMPYYNGALGKKGCSRVIDDTYAFKGRPATIDLLDSLKNIGFKRSTLAGLSFGITDLRIPPAKQTIIDATQKKVDRVEKAYNAGAITDRERYNQLLDLWTHCRETVTKELLKELAHDRRDDNDNPLPIESEQGTRYLNPVWLMADSGARGNVSQIQQLAGMRGLMSKPSGEIIETPIKANAREGMNVLEYFSSTHGARKGLADTALKTADSGYLTRKLADVAQNIFVAEPDCNTKQGVTKRAIYKGEEIDVPLREHIVGRTARETIRNPISDELIVQENEWITPEAAAKIEALGIDAVVVRSPLTCEARQGICAKCYGQDLSTGRQVEEGLAVGIIAAQSIGEPGTQLTMRTFHTGGIGHRTLVETDFRATQAGTVELRDANEVPVQDEDGTEVLVSLKRNGELAVLDDKGRELEKFKIQYGSYIIVKPGEKVKKGQVLCKWDPHRTPILAEKAGVVRFEDVELGETVRPEQEAPGGKGKKTGGTALVVIEHKGEKHPRIVIEEIGGSSGQSTGLDDKDVHEHIKENYEYQFVETADLSPSDQKELIKKLEKASSTSSDDSEETGWLKASAHKLFESLKSMITGEDPVDVHLKKAKEVLSGSKWHVWPPSPQRGSDPPKGPGLCFLKNKQTNKVDFISRSNNVERRLYEHFKGNVKASSFFKFIHDELMKKSGRSVGTTTGKILDFHYLPAKARIEVEQGQKIKAGHMLARQPREVTGSADIVGGLPRVTEIFEARKPKDAAVMAEITGTVELRSDKRRGKMTIIIRSESGLEVDHHVPQDRHLLVHTGDFVTAGDPLIDGPLVPQDILRVKGEEALHSYLLEEVQNVYRAQGVPINDKHIEVTLTQMLRKVRIENPGDTYLLPNEVVDKFRFRDANEQIANMGKIKEPGDSGWAVGTTVSKSELKEMNAKLEAEGKQTAKATKCRPASAKTLLLGITKASLQSESFLSGASFQETTKVLTEAALAGKSDPLEGLKENVLLGHLIPVGTGFKKYQNIKVQKLAEPPAQEAPTREEELETAAALAEAAGAQSPEQIQTTVGESRLVAQLLGEENANKS
jgi:DNA-directed RNA polymerase subunit beta'